MATLTKKQKRLKELIRQHQFNIKKGLTFTAKDIKNQTELERALHG
jgi:hypothetical protein